MSGAEQFRFMREFSLDQQPAGASARGFAAARSNLGLSNPEILRRLLCAPLWIREAQRITIYYSGFRTRQADGPGQRLLVDVVLLRLFRRLRQPYWAGADCGRRLVDVSQDHLARQLSAAPGCRQHNSDR